MRACDLELEFHRELHQSGRRCADYGAEIRIVDFAVDRGRSVKLRMIENVEIFEPDIERLGLGETHRLADLDVEVLDPRPVEKPPRRIAELTQRFGSEPRGVKGRPAISRIGVDLEWPRRDLRRVEQLIVDSVAQRSEKGPVGVVKQRDRESGAETRGALNTKSSFEVVVVCRHEVLREIECGDHARGALIEGIDLFSQIRRVIDRF